MGLYRVNDANVRDTITGELRNDLVGKPVKIVLRDTTTAAPIFDGVSDPIVGAIVYVTPVFTTPPFYVEVDDAADLYLDWLDVATGARGPVDFDAALRAAAQEAAGQAATAATAAVTAQLAAEAARSQATAAAATAVRSVNGLLPDGTGNVTVATGSGGTGGAVTSVAGRTGAVTLVKGDVGLGQVDNTADVDKPVSTPQAAALAGKANTSHTHTIANVTSLQAALDAKAGLNAAVNASQLNAGTGVVTPARLGSGTPSGSNFLRGDGTWATPPGGGTGGAVDSVNGQTGEVVLDAADVGALPSSTVLVTSVAGRTGAVTLAKADVALGNVDNTSDASKPVSTAQAAAIALKATDTAVVHNSGNETVAGTKTFSSAPVVPDASFPIAKTSGLQAALDGKMTAGTGVIGALRKTQAEYDALTPVAGQLYVIVG